MIWATTWTSATPAEWHCIIEKLCTNVGTVLSIPRLCNWQVHRSNAPARMASEYNCCTITIPLLDHLLSEMKTRFGHHQQTCSYRCFPIVPAILLASQTLPEEQHLCLLTFSSWLHSMRMIYHVLDASRVSCTPVKSNGNVNLRNTERTVCQQLFPWHFDIGVPISITYRKALLSQINLQRKLIR